MKLVEHFNTLLSDVVNLNSTRVRQLEESVDWEAKDYLNTLFTLFANHATYKDKVRRFSHCVTIEYAGERNIDLAVCVVDRNGVTRHEVCNRDANEFEATEPEKYTDWLIERNEWTGGNGLRKVTRLLKYLRDIKETFSCPSVLLTTLLGARVIYPDAFDETRFADVPTTLKTIVDRLDDWLQVNQYLPTVINPVLASEILSEAWDDAGYANFRNKIRTYRNWIEDAYAEPDRDESIGKWRRVFGDEFAKSAAIEKAARVSVEASILAERNILGAQKPMGDLVTLFVQFCQLALIGFHTNKDPHGDPCPLGCFKYKSRLNVI